MGSDLAYKNMDCTPSTLGYVAYLRGENGDTCLAERSLQALISNRKGIPFPVLKNEILRKTGLGVTKKEVFDSPMFVPERKSMCAIQRFLKYIRDNGGYEKFGIPKNRLIITTNRNVILKIIKFARREDLPQTLLLQRRMQIIKENPLLAIRNAPSGVPEKSDAKIPFGVRFNHFLANNSNSTEKVKCTLFSVNLLVLENACFIYECEIDAIVKTDDESYQLTEIKTEYDRDSTLEAFKTYADENKNPGFRNDGIPERFREHILQGELGNNSSFIYGFVDGRLVKTQKFCAQEHGLLQYDLCHLRSFSKLALNSKCTDSWEPWDITRGVSNQSKGRS